MKDEQLKRVLDQIDICECEEIIRNHIFYCKRKLRQRSSCGGNRYRYVTDEFELLIIAENGEKQGIILRCGELDLHWYVYRRWRKRGVLSDALRTGIILQVCPENREISCCCGYGDVPIEKLAMTKHLAEIAGLTVREVR